MSSSDDDVTIIGAGLVGSLLGIILQNAGYRVTIYERFGDIRAIPSAGRSINLVATVRGLRALSVLPPALKAELLELGTKVTGRIIHLDGTEPVFQRYGKDDSEYNHSISRYDLNKFLISRAEAAGVALHFGHKLVNVDLSANTAKLNFVDDGGREVAVTCAGPLVGADGAGSALRYALRDAGHCSFVEEKLESGYKEMSFPADAAAAGGMAAHGLHIWPRGDHMLMGLANLDGSFTGTFYMRNEGDGESFASVEASEAASLAFLEQHYADALPLLGTVRTDHWAAGGKAVLIGDASHAIVPFFGQGMNAGFEDAKELAAQLAAHAPAGSATKDYAAAFAAFSAARKPNADAIADMALENYVEMRASTADPAFRKRKAVENAMENSALGSRFRSRYAMVCYGGAGGVTYAAAQALGAVQWQIVGELADGVSSAEAAADELDLGKAEALLDEKLAPLQRKLQVDLDKVSHHE